MRGVFCSKEERDVCLYSGRVVGESENKSYVDSNTSSVFQNNSFIFTKLKTSFKSIELKTSFNLESQRHVLNLQVKTSFISTKLKASSKSTKDNFLFLMYKVKDIL